MQESVVDSAACVTSLTIIRGTDWRWGNVGAGLSSVLFSHLGQVWLKSTRRGVGLASTRAERDDVQGVASVAHGIAGERVGR